jgi:hypothetical protein
MVGKLSSASYAPAVGTEERNPKSILIQAITTAQKTGGAQLRRSAGRLPGVSIPACLLGQPNSTWRGKPTK